MTPLDYAELALAVAREAAALVLPAHRSRPAAVEKRPTELVTEYDLASERLIRARLNAQTPAIPVVGEEQGGTRAAGLTWFCDPIDGTTNFVHGHPFWAVSIGLLDGPRAVAGAVVAPSLHVEWHGASGARALRNGEPCNVSSEPELGRALVATGFPGDRTQAPANNFDAFTRVKRRVTGVRRCGSAAIDVCLVADGTYDAYWERKLSPWDIAAGVAIAQAAGARITALDGSDVDLSIGHLLVSNGQLHDELLAIIGD